MRGEGKLVKRFVLPGALSYGPIATVTKTKKKRSSRILFSSRRLTAADPKLYTVVVGVKRFLRARRRDEFQGPDHLPP